jgi:hypothetical protein
MGLFDFFKRKPAQPEPAPQPAEQDKAARKQYEDMILYGINILCDDVSTMDDVERFLQSKGYNPQQVAVIAEKAEAMYLQFFADKGNRTTPIRPVKAADPVAPPQPAQPDPAAPQPAPGQSAPKPADQPPPAAEARPLTEIEQKFDKEVYESLQRYYSTPGLDIRLNLTEADGTVCLVHEALDVTYGEWQQIHSKWDRLSLLYALWDQSDRGKLAKWQIIEREVKDRYGIKAYEYYKAHITTDDYMEIRVPVAVSKMFRVLTSVDQALYFAERAYQLRPDLDLVKAEYASVLHLTGLPANQERAHQLMNEVLQRQIEKSGKQEIALLNFFVFSEGYIDSSVFAASYLNAGHAKLADWNTMAEEYYYCPYFRYEHAVKLAAEGEALAALAKLTSLSQEFPWFKQGLSTTINTIHQFRKQLNNPQFMEEELVVLQRNLAGE